MGSELPDIRRPHRGDIGHGENLSTRSGAAGGTDRRDHNRRRLPEWRLHCSADQGFGGLRYGLAGVAVFTGMVAAGILWRQTGTSATTFEQFFEYRRTHFITGADANNLILQMRTWERHDVGATPGFGGDAERALRSIKVPLLYMPSETDLYFPIGDARYEAGFIPGVSLVPIPSLWGHTAGAASNPADAKFLNETIGRFLSAGR